MREKGRKRKGEVKGINRKDEQAAGMERERKRRRERKVRRDRIQR